MNLNDVSVIITSFNKEATIARCLERARAFGEVVLVDGFSTDGTVDIARRFGVTIYSRPFGPERQQTIWALSRVSNPWVLLLEADEAPSHDLMAELERLDASDATAGYWVRREHEYLGRRIRCSDPGSDELRLIRRVSDRYEYRPALDGTTSRLLHEVRHFPHPGIKQHFADIERRSSQEASDYVERGGRAALLRMIVLPPLRFWWLFFIRRGGLDGWRGFIFCLLSSYGEFLECAKAWELSRARSVQ
jgi:glycosyltransferase involved in cell wall biosynthesis